MSTRSFVQTSLRTAACVILALQAASVAAQPLTLTVPYRGPSSMQAASTSVELDASAIAGGATVSVDGVSVPVAAVGCAGNACVNADLTPDGDDIVVRRISGTTRARLELTYLSVFPVNYCSFTGAAIDRVYDVELTGFTFANPTNGYRITSFMAPSAESCDVPYARVPGPRPSVAGSLTKQGRLPLNVVLVLDRSPSMEWTIPGSTDIRWDRLKDSVELFATVWDVIGSPPAPATVSSEGHAEDRLGLIFFGGSASESPLDGANFFKSRGAVVSPWSGPISTALNAGSFIGGTSVGAGTVNGRSRLDMVDSVLGDTAIVLFTDGEQNTPPCILRQGEVTSPTVKPYPGLPGVTYTDQCTVAAPEPPSAPLTVNGTHLAQNLLPRGPIFTIGLGEGGMAASAQLLDEISSETAGRSRFPNDGPSMDTSFVDSLVDNLKGGTVSMLDRTTGEVPAGATSAPLEVIVDPSLTRVTWVLAWSGRGHEVELEIRDPGGSVVTPSVSAGTSASRVVAVDLPSAGPDGVWQARVVHFSGSRTPLDYHLTAYGTESRLSARVTESPRTGTGEPLEIVAEVGWGDEGLEDLPKGAIRATIERPAENLGNILHRADRSVPDSTPEGLKDISPLMLKIGGLAGTSDLLDKIEPTIAETIELVSVGHGRYEGKFDGVEVGGKYRIRVDFDWNDPRTDEIRRISLAERPVAVRPTPEATAVEVIRELDGGGIRLLVTPEDGFGNLVGPGFENRLRVDLKGPGKAGVPTDPEVTGVYVVDITGLPPGDDPRVEIVFDGETLRDGPLSRVEDESFAPAGAVVSRWSLSLHAGQNDPAGDSMGDFWFGCEGDLSWGLDLEYRFDSTWAAELFYGHEDLECPGRGDHEVEHLSLNGKAYFLSGTWRPFLGIGIGSYDFSPGSSEIGFNLFGGLQANVTSRVALEATGRYHRVDADRGGNSVDADFFTYHLGARFRF